MYNPFFHNSQEYSTTCLPETGEPFWEEPRLPRSGFDSPIRYENHIGEFPGTKVSKTQTESSRLSRQIFVGGLPTNVTPPLFREWAEIAFPGRVVNAVLVVDRLTHTRSRGFGFVTFDSNEMVEIASRMRLLQFAGKIVEVKKAENVSISQRKKINTQEAAPSQIDFPDDESDQFVAPQRSPQPAKRVNGALQGKAEAAPRQRKMKNATTQKSEVACASMYSDRPRKPASDLTCEFLIPHLIPQSQSDPSGWLPKQESFRMSPLEWEKCNSSCLPDVPQATMAFQNQQYHSRPYHWKDDRNPQSSFENPDREWTPHFQEQLGIDGPVAGLLALQASIVNMAIDDGHDGEGVMNIGAPRTRSSVLTGQLSGACARASLTSD